MTQAFITSSPYDLMQDAVDIVQNSSHASNKVAATLAIDEYAISKTNNCPLSIKEKFTDDTKIGNSSGSIHAETACIIQADNPTEGASIFVTDPPCPNCMKNIIEAGIKDVYIDHKGFDKDFAQRRGHHFSNLSMQFCQQAGVSVYELWRKEELLEPILLATKDNIVSYKSLKFSPMRSAADKLEAFNARIAYEQKHSEEPFALVLAQNNNGECRLISANTHLVIGFQGGTLDKKDAKYSHVIEPMNRVIMAAARKGYKIDPDFVYSSRIPTSRELVNMVGAGLTTLHTSEPSAARDEHALTAIKQLTTANIMNVIEL